MYSRTKSSVTVTPIERDRNRRTRARRGTGMPLLTPVRRPSRPYVPFTLKRELHMAKFTKKSTHPAASDYTVSPSHPFEIEE